MREIKHPAIDSLIRAGQVAEARAQVEAALVSIPDSRDERLELAALSRRVGRPLWSVRLLNSIVRPGPRQVARATAAERTEYAGSLAQIGAEDEALALLAQIDPTEEPQSLLFAAFARFSRWDYAPTIPSLKKYVRHPALTDYARLIGKVNLAAALVSLEDVGRAEPLLDEIAREAMGGANTLLLGTSLMLSAQLKLLAGDRADHRDAKRILDEAELGTSDSWTGFLIRKWRWVAEIREEGVVASTHQTYQTLRAEAIQRAHGESVRDCDFHWAVATEDRALLAHLYFGTPFEAYRERLARKAGYTVNASERFDWMPGEIRAPARVRVIDVTDGIAPGGKSLKPGQVQHRMLAALSSDFYRGFTVATLHARVFPDRHFSPLSSPQSVHQALKRLRAWIGRNGLPIEIAETQSVYRFTASAPAGLRVGATARDAEGSRVKLRSLSVKLGQAPFSSREAAAAWGVTDRSARLWIAEAVARGELEVVGAGPQRRYRLKP